MEFDEPTARLAPPPLERALGDAKAACLLVVGGRDVGALHRLAASEAVIGRGPTAHVRLGDEGVSLRHASLVTTPEGGLSIADLGSSNGTYVRGARIAAATPLKPFDIVQVGGSALVYVEVENSVESDFMRGLYNAATRDMLTCCFNKVYFAERLVGEFAFARRNKRKLCLAMVDVDGLGAINDTFGRTAGDGLLSAIAQVLHQEVRRGDVVARYGGEEFCVLFREIAIGDCYNVVERIRRLIGKLPMDFAAPAPPPVVSVSIGIAALTEEGPGTAEDLVKDADGFLELAKKKGKNRTECALFV